MCASRHRPTSAIAIAEVDFGPFGATIRCQRPDRTGGVIRDPGREEDGMKFMFAIYHDERVLDALPEGEMQALVDSALDYTDELRRSGHYIVSNALQRPRTARTIRVKGGKV